MYFLSFLIFVPLLAASLPWFQVLPGSLSSCDPSSLWSMPAMSPKTAWFVGSGNTPFSGCLSRPVNEGFFPALAQLWVACHPLLGFSILPLAVTGDSLRLSVSPYCPGIPITLLL